MHHRHNRSPDFFPQHRTVYTNNNDSGDSIKSYKPDPAMYKQAIRLSGLEPGKCAMVAAHAYDLDAAKKW